MYFWSPNEVAKLAMDMEKIFMSSLCLFIFVLVIVIILICIEAYTKLKIPKPRKVKSVLEQLIVVIFLLMAFSFGIEFGIEQALESVYVKPVSVIVLKNGENKIILKYSKNRIKTLHRKEIGDIPGIKTAEKGEKIYLKGDLRRGTPKYVRKLLSRYDY